MSPPPDHLTSARVLFYTPLDSRHRPTGAAHHAVHGHELGPVAGLALCQYEADPHVYIFYCSPDWQVITETCHHSLQDARKQAEAEYKGVGATWSPLHDSRQKPRH